MLLFSCADYAFPLLPRERRLALLRVLGFNHVDLGLFECSDGLRPGQLFSEPRKSARQLKRDLLRAGLEVADIFLQTGVAPEDSAENDPSILVRSRNRKAFMLALELSAELGCVHMTGLPGVQHKSVNENDCYALAAVEAGWRHHAALHSGVCYAIKPHTDSICSSVVGARSLLDAVPGLTLTLDYGHFVSQNISSREVHSLLPFVSHIQVHGAAPNLLQAPMNENKIDFGGMIRRLYKQKYKGVLAIQYVRADWKQCNHPDNVSETILLRRQLAKHMKPEPEETVAMEAASFYSPCSSYEPVAQLEQWPAHDA
jgi:sugar phosphate isomerase/epimerase